MTLTQAQTVEQVRIRLDESTDGFWKDNEIRKWINEGVREVARRSEWNRTTGTIAVVAGTQTYLAPTATIRIYRIEWQPTGTSLKYPLEYADINQMDSYWGIQQSISQGLPELFTTNSANPPVIELYPTPGQAGQLNVFYFAMPTDLATDTNTAAATAISVPMGWEDLVVEYATALGFRKAREVQMYGLTMQAFSEKITEFIGMSERYVDMPTNIMPHTSTWDFMYY